MGRQYSKRRQQWERAQNLADQMFENDLVSQYNRLYRATHSEDFDDQDGSHALQTIGTIVFIFIFLYAVGMCSLMWFKEPASGALGRGHTKQKIVELIWTWPRNFACKFFPCMSGFKHLQLIVLSTSRYSSALLAKLFSDRVYCPRS